MSLSRRWLAVCVGLLVVNALAMACLVVASSARRPTLLPQYYERAVAWDETMAEELLQEQVGWQIDCELSASGALFRVRDRDGHPVSDVTITATGFHRSHPDQSATFHVTTDDRGVARAHPQGTAASWTAIAGWYEFDLQVHRGAIRYSLHRTITLADGPQT
jgi:nitrogen fixation protein FixH